MTEKDSAASSVTNHYQSISYMQPYNKYSFEELRLGDYNQGRRFGNGSGQAGAFGTSAFGSTGGFGQPASGFGSTSTPFGGGTSAPTGFGQTQTAGGFGSTSSNPLFGASKPANSLFGGTSGTSQPSAFGGTAPTSGGFGSSTGTGGFGSGGSLFGNNQQQQNKPLFGSTGGTGTTGGTGFGGFGQQTTSAPNPFGGTTGTASPFGGQQQTGTGLGGFGQQNQAQAQPQTQNKGLFGGGFGANTQQQQGGGLFGGGTAGSSLFGQNNQQQQQQPSGGSLFGGANQQTGTSSLFGGGTQQQGQKSLFGGGATGTATGTGGGLFGNTQNQQTGTSSLFGGAQNQQQQKPSLFGGSTGTGGSLFGGQPSAPQSTGPSLFGNPPPQQQQQQQAGGFGTSGLFGNTQQPPPQAQQQPQQPAPGSFQASIMDPNPYGSQSIFSGLPALSGPSPGPLATPLSSAAKQKQSQRTPLPIHKMTPSASNRLSTPPKRPGYGFSYSTYGTPTSSTGTPTGFGGSLLGSSMRGSLNGSLGRSFSKSYSTSSLRNAFDPDAESVLSPGALSGPSRLSSGNIKRLTIDRSLRNNLFSGSPSSTPPAPITNGEDSTQQSDKSKKKVSFDATSTNGVNGASGEVVPVESKTPEPTPEELGFLRSIRNDSANGVNGGTPEVTASARPEMESVQGLEAKDVETTPTAHGLTRLPFSPPGADPQPGEYWMKPTRAEISRMTREEQKHVVDFTVGRQNCGRVTFGGAVDLTTVNLDLVFGGIVDIALRRITVYPDESVKPPLGKGLNVPSTLRIENSWPRGRDKRSPTPLTSGPLFEKHVDRLVKVHNTEFIDYELQTGTWVFKVPHFTTYGLDYDSDEEGESRNQGTMAAPDTPKAHPTNFDQSVGSELSAFSTEDSFVGSTAGVDDDTFDFKKRKIVPGSFGNQEMEMAEREESFDSVEDGSFLEEGSTGSTTEQDNTTESQQSEVGLDEDAEMDMAGSFPTPRRTVERDDTPTDRDESKPWNTPAKARLDLSGDWTDQLERTISPRKQDRAALREIQANAFSERHLHGDTEKPADAPKGFTTSIDLMNSLFHQPRKQQVQPKGFEV